MIFESLLSSVGKPSRYIGGEVNAPRKTPRPCGLSFALAFPDTYEVGMSHPGLQILYAVLNDTPGVVAERCFAPWPDMEEGMRRLGLPLSSMESRTPLNRFDIVGFSLQYELSYTNVLNMLELGRIPLRRADRRDGDPLIIAGGPCAFNPAPMSRFIDAFAIGEGEEIIGEISAAVMAGKARGVSRNRALEALAGIEGLYVPAVHGQSDIIRKRVLQDFTEWRLPSRPVVPVMKTIHDRVTLEIARGCTRGCRFCQAGMVWRPVREKNPATLVAMADGNLSATGYDEISLLSLSAGDYTYIEPLLSFLMDRYHRDRVALALPSLRVETLTKRLIDDIRRVRKTSFTLAPEAGTQRLQDIINKGNTEEELLATARRVFDAGWKRLKLYFMIGLPGETDGDLEGITDLARRVLAEGGNRGQVTVSLSTFVPKPHTPFQWSRQISMEETLEKQDYFRRTIRRRNLPVKWHDHRMSWLEGILSRGSEQAGRMIEEAYQRGARFDGWSDLFRFSLWETALAHGRDDVTSPLEAKDPLAPLPWDRIDAGPTRDFLRREAEKAALREATPDCRSSPCHHCGACDHVNIKTALAVDEERVLSGGGARSVPTMDGENREKRFRILFGKEGLSRLLSHLETASALTRAIKQGGLRFVYSRGFHPHPRISFAVALPVGVKSLGEYADIRVAAPVPDREHFIRAANRALPSGMTILDMTEISPAGAPLSETILGFRYRLALPGAGAMDPDDDIGEKIRLFLDAPSFVTAKTIRDRTVTRDIRPLVEGLQFDAARRVIDLRVRRRNDGTLNPLDFLRHVLGMDAAALGETQVTKTETFFRSP
ncbi:MAG: TIGR03960 family B12-binding radical SAM protein [Deltaproteobacteria bacterium]|nr:TIGR03960 family B12-binding radical SAM protein [Deltaproteobacteria bacterium]